LRRCQALRLAPGVHTVFESGFGIRGRRLYARIDDRGGAVVKDGTSAENSILVGASRSGRERDRFMMPVNHVIAGGVRPVHVAPDGGLRIVLVEHVIAAAIEDGSVGIVHPIVSGEKVILRPQGIGGEFAAEFGIRPSHARVEG
jgi:hypothetical protein